MISPESNKNYLKIIFIIPFWYEDDKKTIACSPFLIPQINDISKLISAYQIVYIESGMGIRKLFNNYLKLLKVYYNTNEDTLIYSMYGSFHGFLVWIVLGRKFKIVNCFGGSDVFGSTNKGIFWIAKDLLTKRLSLFVANNVSHIIVKSANLKNHLSTFVSTPISVIPNGVDLTLFKVIHDKEKLRNQFNFLDKEFIVLFNLRRKNSKTETVKNLKLAEKVIYKLDSIIDKSARLVFITDLNQKEINLLFNSADCLLLTSFHEGSPNIIKEAMATNLPIVSVDCGDVKERLQKTKNSFVSNDYDVHELSNYCKQIYLNNQRSNGREELIRQKIDSVSVTKKIIQVFESLKKDE